MYFLVCILIFLSIAFFILNFPLYEIETEDIFLKSDEEVDDYEEDFKEEEEEEEEEKEEEKEEEDLQDIKDIFLKKNN